MMKVLVFGAMLFGLVLLNLDVYAQGLGIRAGFQSANTTSNGTKVGNSLDNFYLGLFKNRTIGASEFLMLNSGLEYMQNGYRINDSNFRKIDYLSIPLGLRANFGPFYAQGGINANIKIGEKYEINGSDALTNDNKTHTFDAPLHLGIGFRLFVIDIEARYHHSFMDVNNGNKNSYLQLGAAFRF